MIQTILSVPGSRNLIVIVLNAPEDPDPEHLAANKLFKARVSRLSLENTIFVLDETHRFLPGKQGVGLARKMGCDLALQLISDEVVRSPWIFTTDADAQLPADYFERVVLQPPGACIYPFHHLDAQDPAQTKAIRKYEAYMQSYVNGLCYAGSGYAYHAIGSTLSIHAHAYAQVRGFPKRAAGEDFYILNKIRKIGSINSLDGYPILLSSRLSNRTPFGTGQSVADIASGAQGYFYPPEIFEELREWLDILQRFCEGSGLDTRNLSERSQEFLASSGILNGLQKHFFDLPITARKKAVFDYFDALKTLRFINCLHRCL